MFYKKTKLQIWKDKIIYPSNFINKFSLNEHLSTKDKWNQHVMNMLNYRI